MRRKLKNFWMHPNENLCRSLDLFGQDVYHNRTMLPPRETMLGSNLCKRTLQRCLCTNLPQFRRYSARPNILGTLYAREGSITGGEAAFEVHSAGDSANMLQSSYGGSTRVTTFEASRVNTTFGNSSTNQPSSLRALALIRAY